MRRTLIPIACLMVGLVVDTDRPLHSNLSAGAYRAIILAAREQKRPVTGHVPRSVTIGDVFAAGQAAVEHLSDFDDAVEADDSPLKGKFHWSKLILAMPFDPVKAAAM